MTEIANLLSAYFDRSNWPFISLHVIVGIYAARQLWKFWDWEPSPDEEGWQQLETRAQLLRGIIGLLLLIGIAGTFAGLFTLSTDLSASASSPEGFRNLLQRALRKAFPIGFMGLILTLTFSIVADFLEKEKSNRIDRLKRHSSHQFEVMVSLLRDIKTGVVGLPEAVALALQPVSNLESTLKHALQPAIESLDHQLTKIGRVLQDQGEQLIQGKDALVSAAKDVRDASLEASDAIKTVAGAADRAMEALGAAQGLAAETQALLATLRQSLNQSATEGSAMLHDAAATLSHSGTALVAVVRTIEALPQALGSSAATAITDSIQPIVVSAQHGLEQIGATSQSRLDDQARQLEDHVRRQNESVVAATEKAAQAAAQQLAALQEILLPGGTGVFDDLHRSISDAGNTAVAALNDGAETYRTHLSTLSSELSDVNNRLMRTVDSIAAALERAHQPTEVAAKLDDLLNRVTDLTSALEALRKRTVEIGQTPKSAGEFSGSVPGVGTGGLGGDRVPRGAPVARTVDPPLGVVPQPPGRTPRPAPTPAPPGRPPRLTEPPFPPGIFRRFLQWLRGKSS